MKIVLIKEFTLNSMEHQILVKVEITSIKRIFLLFIRTKATHRPNQFYEEEHGNQAKNKRFK